ncbi:LacI family DNA-binding transcriptional regulator [Aminobacter aminovorans]|uniref:LacI family DNA-binding transcriptional regulator n=1 Tax=Aminobacter aminovorans TaxID=83263 RepID=UPI0028627B29|nr:LacI family DNA-binding transcriptional regulator [Aminobacter aminovorans]MDR7222380.1 LacI family transcriptional regulator [Aminobacter aminovorans]
MTSKTDPDARPQRVTIKDIAKRANVGVGTVSRVLNDHPLVSEEVRANVKAIIAELRYKPNLLAQNMRSSSSKTFGIVVPNLVNPFFAELVQAVEEAARAHHRHVYLMTSLDDAASEQECIDSMETRRVDGIVLIPADSHEVSRARRGARIVLVDRIGKGQAGIGANHFTGARLAAERLLELGHRRIAIIAGPQNAVTAAARLEGFMSVMAPIYDELDIDPADFVFSGPFDMPTGAAGARKLFSFPENRRPTAIFASSDQQAMGAMRAIFDLGLSIPRDISILGYDGIPVTDMVTPRLATIAQPVKEIAEAVVAALVSQSAVNAPQLFECFLKPGESMARRDRAI